MTVIVGIKCKDGVVVGADSSATMGQSPHFPTIEQKMKKIQIVGDRVIVAGTGQVGLGQRFHAVVQSAWRQTDKPFGKPPLEIGKTLATMAIQDFQSTGIDVGHYGALVAFPSGNQAHLCEFSVNDFQPEFKTDDSLCYASMGSGQAITDPFLGFMRRVFWKDDLPNTQDGIFAVTWALLHAIEINPGGINEPMQIALLGREKGKLVAKILEESDLVEHRENVEGAILHLRSYAQPSQDESALTLQKRPE